MAQVTYLAEYLQAISILSFASGASNLLHMSDDTQWHVQDIGILLRIS